MLFAKLEVNIYLFYLKKASIFHVKKNSKFYKEKWVCHLFMEKLLLLRRYERCLVIYHINSHKSQFICSFYVSAFFFFGNTWSELMLKIQKHVRIRFKQKILNFVCVLSSPCFMLELEFVYKDEETAVDFCLVYHFHTIKKNFRNFFLWKIVQKIGFTDWK